ncbi:MAG: hypothetical protein WDZ51_00750 [Pirellulaceae bacterium]
MKLIIGTIVAAALGLGSAGGVMAVNGSGSAQPAGCACVDCACPGCDGVTCSCEEACECGKCGCAK